MGNACCVEDPNADSNAVLSRGGGLADIPLTDDKEFNRVVNDLWMLLDISEAGAVNLGLLVERFPEAASIAKSEDEEKNEVLRRDSVAKMDFVLLFRNEDETYNSELAKELQDKILEETEKAFNELWGMLEKTEEGVVDLNAVARLHDEFAVVYRPPTPEGPEAEETQNLVNFAEFRDLFTKENGASDLAIVSDLRDAISHKIHFEEIFQELWDGLDLDNDGFLDLAEMHLRYPETAPVYLMAEEGAEALSEGKMTGEDFKGLFVNKETGKMDVEQIVSLRDDINKRKEALGPAYTFQPGSWKVDIHMESGLITKVLSGGQAEEVGIQDGWKITHIAGLPYQQEILRRYITGDKAFEAHFKENEERQARA